MVSILSLTDELRTKLQLQAMTEYECVKQKWQQQRQKLQGQKEK
jgi:hypothetical protein